MTFIGKYISETKLKELGATAEQMEEFEKVLAEYEKEIKPQKCDLK